MCLAALFRASEAAYGPVSTADIEKRSGLARLPARKAVQALRDSASIPRRQLSGAERRGAMSLIRRSTPLAALMSRHTRALLRRYHAAGLLDTRIATRQVDDRFIDLSPEERALYQTVEHFIADTYDKAQGADRNAVGFVMTIYRRRLASSFQALRRTLESRRAGVEDQQRLEEDAADLTEAGDQAADETAGSEGPAARFEETATIETILARIARLPPTDTKAAALIALLDELAQAGCGQVMVFTQFTDTLDYLRDQITGLTARSVMCFSGRGGEVRAAEGWKMISREEVKRRFREGAAEILLCTDAAAEGLNFQFCGALVNYDLPWNPMRVEQRIGRIDRLGQRFDHIRIVNLHYRNTVEADVYMALRHRIGLFEGVVGRLQPILTRLPKLIETATLRKDDDADGAQRDIDLALAADAESLDLDQFGDADLSLPPRPPPALTLEQLAALLATPDLLPPPIEASRLDAHDYRYVDPDLPGAIRVTLDRDFFDQHADSAEFWTQGSPAFPGMPERVAPLGEPPGNA